MEIHPTHDLPEWISTMNDLGSRKIPFFFLIDFEMKKAVVLPFPNVQNILFNFNGVTNQNFSQAKESKRIHRYEHSSVKDFSFKKFPISFKQYKGQFMSVLQHIKYGNSFLVNLTHRTSITTSLSLDEIYYATTAKYKLKYRDEFVIFSPESFVKIDGQGLISTYPMKGTIDASLPDAAQILINDEKELAEHYTIVDLLRNDLSRVAKNVHVSQFRYLEKLITNQKTLLQASSKIKGKLPNDWMNNIGTILHKLLPAGSICGAPKDKTCSIIAEVEEQDRGYYTGVTGIYDGVTLDSGVAIRYVEKDESGLWFRSGCGITNQSNVKSEYEEMIDKIYVPIG